MAALKGALKAFLLALWTLLLAGPQALTLLFVRGPRACFIPCLWQRGVCLITGLRAEIAGTPRRDGLTLFVANHLSYLDIPLIGKGLPASFVAKAEVASWPICGFLCRMQQTAFVSRARGDAIEGRNALQEKLAMNQSLILFPEGTSTVGREVLPFKSSLFSLALNSGRPLKIQPVTVELLEVDGRPAGADAVRDFYAWYGDMTLAPHFWAFLKSRGAKIRLHFHPARDPAEYSDRKALAAACCEDVRRGLAVSAGAQTALASAA
jgi:1-acyl-sn-glycerol-3-phosphate acyltransferase